MKKILMLLFFVLLVGCLGHEEAEYECQIKVTSGSECSALSGRVRACQILDPFYEGGKTPEYCFNTCLDKSKFLNDVPADCIQVSLAHSRFLNSSKAGMVIETTQLSTVEEDIEEEVCDPDSDKTCCIENSKCWKDSKCIDCSQGDCQVESDCDNACDGDLIQEMGCNLNTATCEKTFTKDCSKINQVFEDDFYYLTCRDAECGLDLKDLGIMYNDTSKEAVDYNLAAQDVRKLIKSMDDIAIQTMQSMAADTLSTTFDALNVISGNWIQLLAEGAVEIVTSGINYFATGDAAAMNKPEIFKWAIDSRSTLRIELSTLELKHETAKAKAIVLKNEINKLK